MQHVDKTECVYISYYHEMQHNKFNKQHEKLRKQHGPNFKLNTVKAILNLRTDISKDERAAALKICKEVLESYEDGTYDKKLKLKNGGAAVGIFDELDMTEADKFVASHGHG